MPNEVKLLPCPFCGSDDIEPHPDLSVVVLCNNCEAQGPRISFGTPNTPEACWNTRPTTVVTDEVVERDPCDVESDEAAVWAALLSDLERQGVAYGGIDIASLARAALTAVEGNAVMAVRNVQEFSNAVSLVVEAIGKCMGGSSLEEQAIAALETCRYADLVSVLHELVYGGGGHVWTRARELLAEIGGGA